MSDRTQPQNLPRSRATLAHGAIRRQATHGQTLVIVLAVMFVLLLIGGIFVAQVARNLTAAAATRDGQAARDLAEAGIRYCDEQLNSSVEGADWRPVPSLPLPGNNDPQGLTDPDYFWLGQLGGFTRISLKGGRALVRVSYEPNPTDPRSNLIKIEAVGRVGDLNPTGDPTVFVQKGSAPKLRRELIAYKQIGLTDYARFITNKDHVNRDSSLGMAATGIPVATVLGDPSLGIGRAAGGNGYNAANQAYAMGYPIRANTNLTFVGDVFLYEGARKNLDAFNQPQFLLSNEGVYSSGKVFVEGTNGATAPQAYLNQDLTVLPALGTPQTIHASDEKDAVGNPTVFSTINGILRDGITNPDSAGFVRSIPRLEPPSLDTLASGTGVLRYRQLTRDSGKIVTDANGKTYNTGAIGWGRGIYVDNFEDKQEETSVSGTLSGYSLRADWLNPDSPFSHGYWQKPYYRPPGVQVELLGDRIRLTRSDNGQFRLPNNQPSTRDGGKVIDIPLSDGDRAGYTLPDGTAFPLEPLDHAGDNSGAVTGLPKGDPDSYGVNVVMMAEGNVRVRGYYGAVTTPGDGRATSFHLGRVHLTIVTGRTAYIDGNIVKADGYGNLLERNSTCAILAKGYVCVNTTMFMSPQSAGGWNPSSDSLEAFHVLVGLSDQNSYDLSYSEGIARIKYKTTAPNGGAITDSKRFLLLRHGADGANPAYINLLVNPGVTAGNIGNYLDTAYPFNPDYGNAALTGTLPMETYGVGQSNAGGIPVAWKRPFELRGFSLDDPDDQNVKTYRLARLPGLENILRFQTDQTLDSRLRDLNLAPVTSSPVGGVSDYKLGGVAVVPLDIRIEAVLYAQDRSFFIIPGYNFNPDTDDTREAWIATNRNNPALRTRPSYLFDSQGNLLETVTDQIVNGKVVFGTKRMKDLVPFYGEPTDIRITLDGSISENYTAAIGDQTAWMRKWGYIPDHYGSSMTDVIPDMHLRGTDDNDAELTPQNGQSGAYVPGTEKTIQFRTPAETNFYNQSDQGLTEARGIAHGLRFQYDATLAFPYYNATSTNIEQVNLRPIVALRFIEQNAQGANGLTKKFHQILPSVPRLPVCPGLLYFGEPERRINTSVTRL